MENYSYRIEAKTVQTERGEGWQHLIPSRLPARGHKNKLKSLRHGFLTDFLPTHMCHLM